MVDGLNGLRHDAVVGRHHQNGDIGEHGAARTHGGEGLVSRRVKEGDAAVPHRHLIGADVLRDAAGLALGHAGVADIIEQAGLAMIDMAHDHHDRRTRLELGGILSHRVVGKQALFNGHLDFALDLGAQLIGHQRGRIEIDKLADRGHDTVAHQLLDDDIGVELEPVRQLTDRDLVRYGDFKLCLAGLLQLDALQLFSLALALLILLPAALLRPLIELLLVAESIGILALAGARLARRIGDIIVFDVVFVEVNLGAAGIDDAVDAFLRHRLLRLLWLLGLLACRLLRLAFLRLGGRLAARLRLRRRGFFLLRIICLEIGR